MMLFSRLLGGDKTCSDLEYLLGGCDEHRLKYYYRTNKYALSGGFSKQLLVTGV